MLQSFVDGVERYINDYLFLDSIFSQFTVGQESVAPNELFTLYQSSTKPSLTTAEYVKHIIYYADCSRSIVMMALIQIRRLQTLFPYPLLCVNPYTIHRLLLTAIRLCMKFHDDFAACDESYAMVVGVKAPELAKLERHMFEALKFNVFVSTSDFWAIKTIFVKWYGYVVESPLFESTETTTTSTTETRR